MSFELEEKRLSELVKQLLNDCDPAGSRIDFFRQTIRPWSRLGAFW